MYRVLLVACAALADHAGFTTRGPEGRRLCGGGGGGGGGSLSPEGRDLRKTICGIPGAGRGNLSSPRDAPYR